MMGIFGINDELRKQVTDLELELNQARENSKLARETSPLLI